MTGHDQDLRTVVFNVIFHVVELLDGHEGVLVGLRLSCRTPVDVRFAIGYEEIESQHYCKRYQGRRPRNQEHYGNTQNGTDQTEPHVIILKKRMEVENII